MPEVIYKNRKLIVVISIFIIFVCYLTFVKAPFYFDDFYNIVDNAALNSISSALKCRLGGFRPLAYLWFYFDKKLYGLNPFYFRLENIIVHILNFILVFLVLKKLLKEKFEEENAFLLSFFAAIFWALNPVNSQSVAYIVQRMNEIATFFILIGFFFYLKFFNAKKIGYLFVVSLFLVLAVGFKEIGILLVPLCILHYMFCSDFKKGLLLFVVFVILAFLLIFFLPQFDRLLPFSYLMGQPVQDKDFTLIEKFLTSFKVLVDYMIVFLFPLFKNIHLYYDVVLEKSLFSLSVIIPLLIIAGLIVLGLFFYKKNKVVSFSLFAFLLLLFPENSFLPLDLAYQHRMYLPSVFLSLVIAIFLFKILQREVFTTVFLFLCFFLAVNLVIRGVVFSIPEKFYANEMRHAPNNEKIYVNASKNLIEKGDLQQAYYYLENGLKKFPDSSLLAMNMGLFFAKNGNIEKAIYWYKKARKKDNPFIKEAYWNLAVLYLKKKDVVEVQKYIDLLKKNGYRDKDLELLDKKLKIIYSADAVSE